MGHAIRAWVTRTLLAEPVTEIFSTHHMSTVTGYRLSDGREVVVKARPGLDRAARCVAAQAALYRDGFPCPEPLSEVTEVEGMAVHAEAYVIGEERRAGSGRDTAALFASVLADLQDRLERLDPEPPRGKPLWLAWDHREIGVWPEEGVDYPGGVRVEPPSWLTEIAARVRQRLQAVALPEIVGHADWESQHLRWKGEDLLVVHDWDSLSSCWEAGLVGAAAATFASDRYCVLAPLASSGQFLATYQNERKRTFSEEELEIAWAAGLWLAAHNARMEVVYRKPPLVLDSLAQEAGQRLRLAGA